MKSFIRSLAVGGWFVAARFVGRFLGSPLIGATCARLSLGAALVPLAGFYGGVTGALSAGCVSLIIMMLVHGSLSLASAALYVPGIVGGLFLATSSRLTKGLFFGAAMLLFWLHPVGQHAFMYPLLWVVPLVFVLSDSRSLFARALVSSFAVHAVGACWWLYTMPMAPVVWHGMIPLVIAERLVQALLMVSVVTVVEKISCVLGSRLATTRVSVSLR